MTKEEKKNKIISAITTLVVMIIAFIIMAFCGLRHLVPPPAAKKVILVEMTMESGGGGGGNVQGTHRKPTGSPAENLLTQQDVSLPVIPTSTISETSPAENIQEAVEPQPNPNAVYRPGMGGGIGQGSGSGSGTGIGSGLGSGEGSGTGGNIGYGTGGRGYTYMPDLTVNETGTVYIEVHVNAAGRVVDARVINNRNYPTTITNSKIQAECVAKAKTARYKPGKEELRIIVFSL